MKLTTALLIIGCLHAAASGYSQDAKVTLNLKEVSIPHLFKAIEKRPPIGLLTVMTFFPRLFW